MFKKILFFIILAVIFSVNIVDAAIVFDSGTGLKSSSASTTLQYAHTVTSTADPFLTVQILNGGASANMISVSYGGITMTTTTPFSVSGVCNQCILAYLLNSPTGSNNVIITYSTSTNIFSDAASYAGVKRFDVISSSTLLTPTSTTFNQTVTSTMANTWAIMALGAGLEPLAGVSTTARTTDANGLGIFDSNSTLVSPGTTILQATTTTATTWGGYIFTVSADAAAEAVIRRRTTIIIND